VASARKILQSIDAPGAEMNAEDANLLAKLRKQVPISDRERD
jgi:hypothetical protein